MTSYSEHDLCANGIQIHYYRSTPPGGGTPIVMIHGLTDNGMCWVRVADALCDAYDIILPDTRGHGLSEKPASGYSVEDRAADVAGLIDGLGLDRPVLFGHSLGGQVVTAIAALYPDKVRAVVLEDPAWFGDDPQANREASADEWCAGLRADQGLGRAGLLAKVRQDNPGWHADELGPWADAKMQMSLPALREILVSMRPGWQNFLRQIQCPILLVTGESEIIINPQMFAEAAALNPRIREAHIPHTHHCIHRDNFDDYMDKVKEFLNQLG